LSNTTFFDGRDKYGIYYIKNIYMFRHLTLAIFRLENGKNLVSSYTRLMWVVYSGEVRGEVRTSEDDQCQMPKHVVVLYVINSIHISTIKKVVDKYIHSNLVHKCHTLPVMKCRL